MLCKIYNIIKKEKTSDFSPICGLWGYHNKSFYHTLRKTAVVIRKMHGIYAMERINKMHMY